MARGNKRDPMAKRHDETDLQWRSRLARMNETKREKGEGIVPTETLNHGGLEKASVEGDDGRRWDTYRRHRVSALKGLNERGLLSDGQYYAALQIARVAERLERNAGVSCASMEARVDCSGSGGDKLVESLSDVRLERAYSVWRLSLPLPRRMIIDMVTRDHRLKAIAARYNMGWPRASRLLRNALEDWADIYAAAMRNIDQEDVDDMHRSLLNKRWH